MLTCRSSGDGGLKLMNINECRNKFSYVNVHDLNTFIKYYTREQQTRNTSEHKEAAIKAHWAFDAIFALNEVKGNYQDCYHQQITRLINFHPTTNLSAELKRRVLRADAYNCNPIDFKYIMNLLQSIDIVMHHAD